MLKAADKFYGTTSTAPPTNTVTPSGAPAINDVGDFQSIHSPPTSPAPSPPRNTKDPDQPPPPPGQGPGALFLINMQNNLGETPLHQVSILC
jgi:hypothetical protein